MGRGGQTEPIEEPPDQVGYLRTVRAAIEMRFVEDEDEFLLRRASSMLAADPVVTFLLVLVIGIVAGILFDRLAGPIMARPPVLRIDPRHHHECPGGCCWCVRRLSHRGASCARGGGLVTSVIAAAAGAGVGTSLRLVENSDDPWTLAQSSPSGIRNRNRDGGRCPNQSYNYQCS